MAQKNFPPLMILAGGLGTRLGAKHSAAPKAMVEVNGRPFIDHQLSLLHSKGINNIVLCLGHRAEQIIEFVGDGGRFGLAVEYSLDDIDKKKLVGTGGAVLKASKLTGSPFAVLYGDSYLDIDYLPMMQAFEQSHKAALISVYRNKNHGVPSNMQVEDGQVMAYDKMKPGANMEHIDYGLSIFSEGAFSRFLPGQSFDLSEVVQDLIKQNLLGAYETAVPFHEVGTEQGINELETYLQKKQITP